MVLWWWWTETVLEIIISRVKKIKNKTNIPEALEPPVIVVVEIVMVVVSTGIIVLVIVEVVERVVVVEVKESQTINVWTEKISTRSHDDDFELT